MGFFRSDPPILNGTLVEVRSGKWKGAEGRVEWHSFDEADFGDIYYSVILENMAPGTKVALWPRDVRRVA